jgi:hypothetical protein
VLDERGAVVDRWALPHTEQALTRTLGWDAGAHADILSDTIPFITDWLDRAHQ